MFSRVVLLNILSLIASGYLIDKSDTNNLSAEKYFTEIDDEIHIERDADDFKESKAASAFDGVYTECIIFLSYTCIQRKTLLYLNSINNMDKVSVFGDYVKFVKSNTSIHNDVMESKELQPNTNSDDLSKLIDKAVDIFFDKHVLRVRALGKDISIPRTVDEFVGRKRRKGGGGGGGGGGHHDGDGGKKKMMMMAMMCMKMKFMMMVPAMMGMMGMMSFKGMMFSMMSFMISKMMLLMKILEKKNSSGSGGGGDGGWAAGGGGGGAWMPAGGQDSSNNGGGYDANAQWQTRSFHTKTPKEDFYNELNIETSFLPAIKLNHVNKANKYFKDDIYKVENESNGKSRKKRSIIDSIQNAYLYWANKLLGYNNRRTNSIPNQKYKIVNGIKYVYYPLKYLSKIKAPKLIQHENTNVVNVDDTKMMIAAEEFNKGEIVEGAAESRMQKKKFNKFKQTLDDALEDNPWQ